MNNETKDSFQSDQMQATVFASRVVESDALLSIGSAFPTEIDAGVARLSISESSPSFAEAEMLVLDSRPATLRVGKLRAPLSVTVELNVWSTTASEVAIRPPNHLPFWLTEERYLSSVNAVLDALVNELTVEEAAAFLRQPA